MLAEEARDRSLNPQSPILDPDSRIANPESLILHSCILNRIMNPGGWMRMKD
jgi:hypothetical protein